MKPPMLHTAYKIVSTRNAYGDFLPTSEIELACHFREITQVSTNSSTEVYDSDAVAWLEADSGVEKQDILKINGVFFRVERVIKARKLRSPVVQFIKVDLLKYGAIS